MTNLLITLLILHLVVLSELPKPADYTQPMALQLAQPDEIRSEDRRSHPGTRLRMAHACDAGVDVLEVLLEDFTTVLCRRGLRRNAIAELRAEAERNINHQRAIGGGRDLVDLVMDKAEAMEGTTLAIPHGLRDPRMDRLQKDRADRVDVQKRKLQRLYQQAASARDFPQIRDAVNNTRKRIECGLVHDLTEMAVQSGLMSTKVAQRWRTMFTRKNATKRQQRGETIDVFKAFARFL